MYAQIASLEPCASDMPPTEDFTVVTLQPFWRARCAMLAAAPPMPGARPPPEVPTIQRAARRHIARQRARDRAGARAQSQWAGFALRLCAGAALTRASILRAQRVDFEDSCADIRRRVAVRTIEGAYAAFASSPRAPGVRELLCLRREVDRQAGVIKSLRKTRKRPYP